MFSKSFILLGLFASSVAASSMKTVNLCTDDVWVYEVFGAPVGGPPPPASTYSIAPQATATMVAANPGDAGISFQLLTGCDAAGAHCATGGTSGQTPFIQAEVTWAAGGGVNYDLSPLYGYNRGLELATGSAACSAVRCNFDPVAAGCPVPGPTVNGYASCYAPCCESASTCLGTNNCPDATCPHYIPTPMGDPGCHSDFYHSVCPNAFAFPDDDCENYGHSPDFGCPTDDDVTMTVCPAGASTDIDICGGGQMHNCTFPGPCTTAQTLLERVL